MRKPDLVTILSVFTAVIQTIPAISVNSVQLWLATLIIWLLTLNIIVGRLEIARLREWIDAQA